MEKRNIHRSSNINKGKLIFLTNMSGDFDVRGQQGIHFFYWMKCYYSWFWPEATVHSCTFVSCFLQTHTQLFASPDVNFRTGVLCIIWGLLWCFYQLFGLILTAPTHCRGSTFLQICSDEETNSSTFWIFTFSANLHFWVNYPIKCNLCCHKYLYIIFFNIFQNNITQGIFKQSNSQKICSWTIVLSNRLKTK